ncbi:MAG: cytochrome c oxidase subunit 3 [Mariniblastus sp.]|nr:cytochrome c oxidase subunit 3 [Mariniblastus sp.]
MAVADTHSLNDHHDDHGEFIAHHFDSPEQQFDSGKLGIWLFLVTEVLFFSGLFVAYTLYRNHHPEIFEQAHVFLNKYLGGLNTIVLLFSSLTMALGVRAAQLGKNKNCAIYILITMVCATMFLGVKAVEYSHKWDMGILVRSAFELTYVHPEPTLGIAKALHISDYLVWISLIPALLFGGFLLASGIAKLTDKSLCAKFMLGMAVTISGYFLGVVVGLVFMAAVEGNGDEDHASLRNANQPIALLAMTQETQTEAESATHNEADEGDHADDHSHQHEQVFDKHHPDPETLSRDVGTFFSIYYCMTGLHAIHIIAGIGFLAWLYWRSLAGHWRSDYFGPVDYVGLYWHLVDLIWIYLFPLLYLID